MKNPGDLQGIEGSFNPQIIRNKVLLGNVTIPFFHNDGLGNSDLRKIKTSWLEGTEAVVSFESTTAESDLYLNTKNKSKTKVRFGEMPGSVL